LEASPLASALQLLGKPAECLLLVIHGNSESVVLIRGCGPLAATLSWAAIAAPQKGSKKNNRV
jgi:hypothetical protein